MPWLAQQPLELQRVAARLHAHYHLDLQCSVKCWAAAGISFHSLNSPLSLSTMTTLLETRMEITARNLHDGSFRSSLGLLQTQAYSAPLGAVVLMKSGAIPRGVGGRPRTTLLLCVADYGLTSLTPLPYPQIRDFP
jgi:hypothetical protein